MRKTSWIMKLLLVLPVILLISLSAWIVWDQTEKQDGEAVLTSAEESGVQAALSESSREEEVLEIPRETLQRTEAPSGESAGADDTVHILLGGDVYLSSHVISAYDKAGGIQGVLDDGYREEIGRADIFMVNEEFPFSGRGEAAPDKQFTFRLPPARAALMREAGIDMVTLANNHAMDYGPEALADTIAVLEQTGIRHVGAGKDLEEAKKLEIVEVKGKTIGFLAASHVFPDYSWAAGNGKPGMVSAYDPQILLESTKAAKGQCDYLAVYVHWGKEKEEQPQDYQRALGRQLIDAGADLVAGSHPHVLQGIEYYRGKPIVYSLGNFIFGSSIPKTALLRVDFNGNEASLSLIPGTSGAGYTKMLTDEKKLEEFYSYMEKLSFGVQVDRSGNVSPLEK